MTDPEKKEFYRILINKIEVHEDRDNKSEGIIKRIIYNIPVFLNGQKGNEITLTKKSTVETVVQLSKGNISSQNVKVEFSLEEMDMSSFRQGATYEQIQAWVQEK